MNISTILDLVAGAAPDRVAVIDSQRRLSYDEVQNLSSAMAKQIKDQGVERVAWLATNSVLFPVAVFGAAKAGVPFVPMNYRLADDALAKQGERLGHAIVIADQPSAPRLAGVGALEITDRDDLLETLLAAPATHGDQEVPDPLGDTAAMWLFTSGTTGPPKISLLKHRNLSSYILGTVELCSAEEVEGILVSVPPYHVAGLASVLSSFFAARRMVYLENFDPSEWVATAARESITQAMVVPTMMQRILDEVPDGAATLPALRALSYGGGRMPRETIEAALDKLPQVAFTNAYGLTETSSTITLLGPDDHRAAHRSDDPVIARRIGSVGLPVPGLELRIITDDGAVAAPGERGEVCVRGPQVSGQYLGGVDRNDEDWFHTRDEGEVDQDGYLYLHGRIDDVIVRGGENISPGEIEDVLRTHPGVQDVVVIPESHPEWGEVPIAVIVPGTDDPSDSELFTLVRSALRSSRVPDRIERMSELPYNELGKIQRLRVREELAQRTNAL
ncbi:MAG: class I adenylate-forming enzyme family protein [Rhodoglobus sp.]